MKTIHYRSAQEKPAMGEASAGKKKKKKLTPEQIQHQQARLLALSDKEKNQAFNFVARCITDMIIAGNFSLHEERPFSYEEMNGDAVWVLCSESYEDLWEGRWDWPENRKLSTQLCYMARSKMSHQIRDYLKRVNKRKDLHISKMDRARLKEMEKAAQKWSDENSMRDLGFKMAFSAAKDKPEFLEYLKALEKVNCYEYIAEELGLEQSELAALERKVLRFLKKTLRT